MIANWTGAVDADGAAHSTARAATWTLALMAGVALAACAATARAQAAVDGMAGQWPSAREPFFVASDLTAPGSFTRNAEGPEFTRDGRLFVVNCERDGTVCEVHPDGRVEIVVTLPEGSTANAIRESSRGNLLLADYRGHNILRLDPRTRQVSVVVHEPRLNQPNDLALAAGDLLYASDPDWKNGTGQIWRISEKGKATLVASGIGTTNGLAFSPDGRLLYVAETVQRRIWVYQVTVHGQLATRRLFIEFPDYGLDGIKCDADGRLYVTRYGKGTIAVISPAGELVREIALPAKNVSNIVFGGPDGRTAFVTFQDRGNVGRFYVDVAGAPRLAVPRKTQ